MQSLQKNSPARPSTFLLLLLLLPLLLGNTLLYCTSQDRLTPTPAPRAGEGRPWRNGRRGRADKDDAAMCKNPQR